MTGETFAFPKETVAVGDCIAVIGRDGHPILRRRPGASWEKEGWNGARLSYHLNCQNVPRCPPSLKEGLVLHTCDNEWCVKPSHLYLGTAKDNKKDLFERSPTVRRRMSESKIGNKTRLGKKMSESSKAAISSSLLGNKRRLGIAHSEEAKRRISEGSREMWTRRKGVQQ